MTKNMSGWVLGFILVFILAVFHGVSGGEEQRYTNHNYGFSFPISKDMNLYTPDHPGPFTFDQENIFYLANKFNEMVEKLEKFAPQTIGDAKRIPGITPASIINLHIAIAIQKKQKTQYVSRGTQK